jgi:hypothetical protein
MKRTTAKITRLLKLVVSLIYGGKEIIERFSIGLIDG